MKKTIIGFTGKKGSGKSEACKYIEKKLGAKRINFKDPLVAELKHFFPRLLEITSGIYPAVGYSNLFDVKPPIIRALMQDFGTSVRRAQDSVYWTKQWGKSVSEHKGALILTDDVRFINEAELLKKKNGVIVRIVRPGNTHKDNHVSEQEMDAIRPDYTVTAHDIPTLHRELERVLNSIFEKQEPESRPSVPKASPKSKTYAAPQKRAKPLPRGRAKLIRESRKTR